MNPRLSICICTLHGQPYDRSVQMAELCARAGALGEVPLRLPLGPTQAVPLHELERRMTNDHEAIFTPQYAERSGPGSTLAYSTPYRRLVEELIAERGIRSVVDLGCGDMQVMGNVRLQGARYLGVDVITERVARNRAAYPDRDFIWGDIRRLTRWLAADLILCKDVLQHWSNAEVVAWLDELAVSDWRYALITNCNYGPTVNTDIATVAGARSTSSRRRSTSWARASSAGG